jgi:hypothetical protein
MQLLQIDVTPAIAVLGIGCLIAVGLKVTEIRARRRAAERDDEILRDLNEFVRSNQE